MTLWFYGHSGPCLMVLCHVAACFPHLMTQYLVLLQVQRGFRSVLIYLTALDSSSDFLAVGSSIGMLYLYCRRLAHMNKYSLEVSAASASSVVTQLELQLLTSSALIHVCVCVCRGRVTPSQR